MNSTNIRIPGFHKLPLNHRLLIVANRTKIDIEDIYAGVNHGGLFPSTADKIVENAIGTYALPFGVALNFIINQKGLFIPMAVEEPSVIAAASNAAKMIAAGGGFTASADPSIMASQIQIYNISDVATATQNILNYKESLIKRAAHCVSQLVSIGGGPRDLEVRTLADDMIVVHIYTDCQDAMGANMLNTIAEVVGPTIADIAQGTLGLRILSNICDRRLVRAQCLVPAEAVAARGLDGTTTIDRIVNASRFAELDPYRAATHNKGIMNGIDPVVIATGNDWRAVEAGAHAYAARNGQYSPLAVWKRVDNERGPCLQGSIEMPMSLGTVGGTLRLQKAARLALRILGVSSARELAMVAACAGLASNLAALRALATEGIQRGHMALHHRGSAMCR